MAVNTPQLYTGRLILRKFTADDIDAIYEIYADKAANVFLPWHALTKFAQAEEVYRQKYAQFYRRRSGYRYAVCLKDDNVPIGYIHLADDDSFDLGYGLRRPFWGRGIATEACRAVVDRLKLDGVPFITATHDVNNPASGAVMKKLGMRYTYSYREQWQPKNISVLFRMYQLSFDADIGVFKKYWYMYPEHFIEEI